MYCRSVLEQSSVVWSSSITQENKEDLERTQKSFVKLILKNKFKEDSDQYYEESLMKLNLANLEKRRNYLDLNFAKKTEDFKVFHANTERLKK